MAAANRFYVQNFGCRATQADGAALASELSKRGLRPAAERAEADLVIVNTCTVTAEADQDARQAIRRIHRENPSSEILVTGCYAQRCPDQLAQLPGVKWVVGNSHKTLIGDIVRPAPALSPGPSPGLVTIAGLASSGPADHGELAYHGEIAAGGTLVGDLTRQRTLLSAPVFEAGQDRSRPNLKIQDGCNNRCSFCVIPAVRGYSRSAPAEQVLQQVRTLARRYCEIVITGINLGRWGRDLPGRPRLVELLERLLAETAVSKLRLSSVEPMDWTNDLLALAASSERIAKHVHIPLQSGSDRVLRAMRRRYRARHYADRVARAHALMPWAAIGADVMTGFPGETGHDFEQTRQLIAGLPFTYLHVFTYSAREGTPAAALPDQVPKAVKKARTRALRELAAEKNLAFRQSLLGRRLQAITLEQRDGAGTPALTDNYVHVTLTGKTLEAGRMVDVEISRCGRGGTAARLART